MKRQPTEWEKILANDKADKELIFKIHKQLISKKQSKKKRAENETDISPKKTCWWPRGIWKDAQHHELLEKCKSKLQWGTTSYQLEWPLLKSLQITNAGKKIWRKREPSYTIGGNINWYGHYEKQYGVSFRN